MKDWKDEVLQLWKEHLCPKDIADKLGLEVEEVIDIIKEEEDA